jgi:hypothetical protein
MTGVQIMAIRPRVAIEAIIATHGRVEQRQAGEAQKLLADARATAARPWWRTLLGRPVVLGVVVALLLAGEARGQGLRTGNDLLPSCKEMVTSTISPLSTTAYTQGLCSGIVRGVWFLADEIPQAVGRACIPSNATLGQLIRVVVAYMERNPALLNYDFTVLTLNALREAWPCRN